jgi:hypothetical protein
MAVRDLDLAADDRVLPATRGVAYAIVPFLVVAFAVLYPWPTDTGRLFAWHIAPTMTPMVLGSAYLGGAYFFVRAARSPAWHRVKGGFVPVAVFASLMGVATILHWDKFLHTHVAFWLWALLYFTTPFLIIGVWLVNRRYDAPPTGDDLLLSRPAVAVVAAVGTLALATGLVLFASPATAMRFWPWHLTPLTSRVVGAVLCLGLAGIGAPLDRRWSTARIPFQVAGLMLTLMVIAGIRAHAEFTTGRAATWIFAVGFVAAAVGVWVFYWRTERRARHP